MKYKRTIAGVALFWWIGAPGLFAQDYLKQLEETLLKRRNEGGKVVPTTQKEPADPVAPEGESSQMPLELAPADPVPTYADDDVNIEAEILPQPRKATGADPVKRATPAPAPTRPTPRPTPTPKRQTTRAGAEVKVAKPANGGGYLGMTVEKVGNSGVGLQVTEVASDSPAWKAGFRNGDQLIAVAGTALSSVDDLAIELSNFTPGTPIRFLVERGGRNLTLTGILMDRGIANRVQGNVPGTTIDLSRSANRNAQGAGQAFFGATLADMSESFRKQFGIGSRRGASVTEVITNSPAEQAGLLPGDCLVEINGVPVYAANDFQKAFDLVKPGDLVEIGYFRGAIKHDASVQLARRVPDMQATWEGGVVTDEMLTPDYVAALQAELDRVSALLNEERSKVQALQQRIKVLESQR